MEENWDTVVSLVGIFIVALVIRSYFAVDLATEFGTPYLLGGGSDSHYNARIINYIAENHEHLLKDPLRGYPFSDKGNVRPPLYAWSVVLGGHILAPFLGSLDKGIQFSFIFSSAFWGALTIVPVYLIGKKTFGKKAGIAGTFLLTISAGHLERGVITNTNHDAFSLFLVVTAFYFFMRSLEVLPDDKKWISDWMDLEKIKSGLSEFFGNNKRALLYAGMAGMSLGSMALAWKGYAYAVVIILVYFLIQLVIDKFRKQDSLGITVCVFITIMLTLLLVLPWYGRNAGVLTKLNIIQWPLGRYFQIPFLIFLGTFGIGVYFTVTRDLPWILTFSILAIAGILFFAFGPDVIQSAAGQYFVQNKLYSTIAEAQAPMFSRLVVAAGVATFFLSWAGIAFAVWHVISGEWTKSFIFILIWAAFSIYMTTQAARFIFTAAPAYALTAGWVIAIAFDKTDFPSIGKRFRSHRGSILRGVKEGVKIKHISVTLLVVFILLVPNTLTAFDAGIPYEEKEGYEEQIKDTLPEALSAEDYDAARGKYLGAFGYSLDKPTDYWETSWEWLRHQDTDVPPEDRPAFVSWWDYGFECINKGKHPTVADNFQHGYRFTGNVLMAQNESEMLGLLVGRQLQLPYKEEGGFEGDVREILVDHLGEEKTEKLEDIYEDPGSYRREVLSNPERYHPRADDIHNRNIQWAMIMGTLSYESVDTLSLLYRDISFNSGYERLENMIRYFAVDSRLFPTSARDTGVFYAPVKLSGHRIEEGDRMSTPVDFYEIKLIDQQGRSYDSREEVPQEAQITDQKIEFKDMFYNSALYRIFAGYEGQEVGKEEGIPGIDHRRMQPMPGWNLTHFKMEHRTAYFNPYPRDEVENHTDAWKAISLEEAREYQDDENVTVDTSGRSYMRQGVVFLRYYDNAVLRGEATTENGTPISGARITVLDENGVPHHTTLTDSEGRYKTFLPEGNVTVTATTGGISEEQQQQRRIGRRIDPTTQKRMMKQEDIEIGQKKFEISLDQAERKNIDTDGDGRWNYELEKDFEVESSEVSGKVFLDKDGTGEYDEANETLVSEGGQVLLEESRGGVEYTAEIDENGTYNRKSLPPGKYSIESSLPGTEKIDDIKIKPGKETSQNIPISVGELRGNITYADDVKEQKTIELSLLENGKTAELVLGETSNYTFDDLIQGEYTLEVKDEGYALSQGPIEIEIGEGEQANLDRRIRIVKAHTIEGFLKKEGKPISYQKLTVLSRGYNRIITTDEAGEFDIKLPEAVYNIYGTNRNDTETYVHVGEIVANSDMIGNERYEGKFEKGYRLRGLLEQEGEAVGHSEVFITRDSGGEFYLTTNENGTFTTYLPEGYYTIYGMREFRMEQPSGPGQQPPPQSPSQPNLYFIDEMRIGGERNITLEGSEGHMVRGHVERKFYSNEDVPSQRLYSTIDVSFDGSTFTGKTDISGNYKFVLPKEETDITFDREGYHEKTVSISSQKKVPDKIFLEAKNISVEGSIDIVDQMDVDRQKPDSWSLEFTPLSDGAFGKEVTVEKDRYEVDLQPGEYEITAKESLDNASARYEIDESLSIRPGDQLSREKGLSAVYKVKIEGNITDYRGEKASAEIHFSGRDDKNISANQTYEVYLQPGDYSIRAVNRGKGLSMQKRLSVEKSVTSDIGLEQPIQVRRYLTYNGKRKGEIPVIFENKKSGYIVRTMTKNNGDFNLSLVEGEYSVKVDFTTEEEIKGMNREVHYSLDEVVNDVGRSRQFELDRKIFNSTFSGHVTVDGSSIQDIEVEVLSQDGEIEKSIRTDEQGYFETELIHGRYSIYIQYKTAGKLYARFESFEMPVENKEIDLSLKEAVLLTGTVKVNGERTEVDELTVQRDGARKKVSTNSDGEYRIIMPKGKYKLISETEKDIEYGLTSFRSEEEIELNNDKAHEVKLKKVEEYGMDIEGLQTKTASQGDVLSYTATVTNTGNTRDEYELSAEEAEWDIEFSPETFELKAGESKSVGLEVYVDENATVDDTVEFSLKSINSEETTKKQIPLEVRRFYGVDLSSDIVNRKYSPGSVSLSVNVTNTGNGKDGVTLRVLNRDLLRDHGWSVHIEGDTEEIAYQETREIEVKLEAISPNPKRDIDVKLRASSSEQTITTDTETLRTSVPSLSLDPDSVDMDSDVSAMEKETFSLSTLSKWQWGAIIVAVAVGALYIAKRKRWI